METESETGADILEQHEQGGNEKSDERDLHCSKNMIIADSSVMLNLDLSCCCQ